MELKEKIELLNLAYENAEDAWGKAAQALGYENQLTEKLRVAMDDVSEEIDNIHSNLTNEILKKVEDLFELADMTGMDDARKILMDTYKKLDNLF